MIGRFVGISGKKIYNWYKEVLSGFTESAEQAKLHEHDTIDRKLINYKTGEIKEVLVPILKPENFGEDMALDDKNIGGEGCTIISNKKTGKIAFLATTTKLKILTEILAKVPVKILFSVKTVSKDLAEGYDWLVRTVFMNAIPIADKFHVVKLAFEALQAVRIRYRQQILSEERKKQALIKERERERKETCRKTGEIYRPCRSPILRTKKYENGETQKELLARSRYLLFKFSEKWTASQKERARILFREFPEIKKAYEIICLFRIFYKTKVGEQDKAARRLQEWQYRVGLTDIEELHNFAATIERRAGEIMNYFNAGHTNAFAESLNSQIQSFVGMNSGTRDQDFFFFRLKNYFS